MTITCNAPLTVAPATGAKLLPSRIQFSSAWSSDEPPDKVSVSYVLLPSSPVFFDTPGGPSNSIITRTIDIQGAPTPVVDSVALVGGPVHPGMIVPVTCYVHGTSATESSHGSIIF